MHSGLSHSAGFDPRDPFSLRHVPRYTLTDGPQTSYLPEEAYDPRSLHPEGPNQPRKNSLRFDPMDQIHHVGRAGHPEEAIHSSQLHSNFPPPSPSSRNNSASEPNDYGGPIPVIRTIPEDEGDYSSSPEEMVSRLPSTSNNRFPASAPATSVRRSLARELGFAGAKTDTPSFSLCCSCSATSINLEATRTTDSRSTTLVSGMDLIRVTRVIRCQAGCPSASLFPPYSSFVSARTRQADAQSSFTHRRRPNNSGPNSPSLNGRVFSNESQRGRQASPPPSRSRENSASHRDAYPHLSKKTEAQPEFREERRGLVGGGSESDERESLSDDEEDSLDDLFVARTPAGKKF